MINSTVGEVAEAAASRAICAQNRIAPSIPLLGRVELEAEKDPITQTNMAINDVAVVRNIAQETWSNNTRNNNNSQLEINSADKRNFMNTLKSTLDRFADALHRLGNQQQGISSVPSVTKVCQKIVYI